MTKPSPSPDELLNCRVLSMLNPSEYEQLARISRDRYRSKSFILREAFQQYLLIQAKK
jgi:hypothetical protein